MKLQRFLSLFPPAKMSEVGGPRQFRTHFGNLRIEMRTALRARAKRNGKARKNRFVLYTRSRSGGTLLIDLLNSHPQIQCEEDARQAELLERHWVFPLHYAENKAVLGSAEVYGFKLKIEELLIMQRVSSRVFLAQMHRRGWKIIYLQRHNILRQAVSFQVAQQTKTWHRVQETEQSSQNRSREKARLDSGRLLQLLTHLEYGLAQEKIDVADLPHLSLSYEDDLQRAETQQQTANRVFEFLGVEPHEVQTQFGRTGSDDIFARVENADEIRAAVQNSSFAHFLDD